MVAIFLVVVVIWSWFGVGAGRVWSSGDGKDNPEVVGSLLIIWLFDNVEEFEKIKS